MPTFLSLTAWQFAAAGAICALGPVIIHLLNRQRYRVVQWAAMDFLREAIQRNRRILQIRDLILLALRTAAILLFGLALARPFFSAQNTQFDHRQPLHAILLVDNSLSMGYQALDGDLLSKAKTRARDFLEQLPIGSKMSIIPICGSVEPWSADPFETAEAAREALDQIKPVDRSANVGRALNQARQAALSVPGLAKRLVLFGDQQALNWQDLQADKMLQDLPFLQVVDVPAGETENSWIASIRVQDELADVDTPTTILVDVAHRGEAARRDVPVTLSLGDTVIGEKTVTLEPGLGTRQIEFQHVFSSLPEPPEANRPVFVTLKASLPPDRLTADDQRFLAVPVVAALPVVFIDQWGDEEDVTKGKIGETRHLRKLLAPKTARNDTNKAVVQIRHVRPENVSQELLSDARLVVVAGVKDPGSLASLLIDYVRQGGQLVVAAGGDFDAEAWQQNAWLEGKGLLPLPLAREALGEVPELAGEKLKVLSLSFESLAGQEVFQLANVSEEELRDLYAEPFFFKAVAVDASHETLQLTREASLKRLADELGFITAADERQEEFVRKEAKGELSEAERNNWRSDDRRRKEIRPQWLTWAQSAELAGVVDEHLPADPQERERAIQQLAERQQPRVLARFTDEKGPAFLVERQLDRGRVLFVSTGLQSSWNTLPKTNAMVIFDRLLRNMVVHTLPSRNLLPVDRLVLPLPSDDRDLRVTAVRPTKNAAVEALDVGFIGQDRRGVTFTNLIDRGVYRLRGYRESELTADPEAKPLWEIPLVVNGDESESELESFSRGRFEDLAEGTSLRWVEAGSEISLAGDAIYSQNSWWWVVLLVLVLLLVEMGMLAWPSWRESALRTNTAT